MVLLTGCDLFSTRSVEPPTDPRSNFTPPTSFDIVVQNMQFAIAEKNLNNYMQCFVDTNFTAGAFVFNADVEAEVQFPILDNWGIQKERSYFNNLLALTSPGETSTLFFSNELVLPSLDSVIYDSDYLLVFNHSKETVAKTVRGKLRFVLKPNQSNFWAIETWSDFKANPEDTTWSILKAGFVN